MDFLDRGDMAEDFLFGGGFQRLHSLGPGDVEDLCVRLPFEDGITQVVVEDHDLKDAGASHVTGMEAIVAAGAAEQIGRGRLVRLQPEELGHRGVGMIRLAAAGANLAEQPLGDDADETVGDEHRGNAELAEDVDGGCGVIGVERAEDGDPGQAGPAGDVAPSPGREFHQPSSRWDPAARRRAAPRRTRIRFGCRPGSD